MNLEGTTHKGVGIRRLAEFDAKDLIGTPFPVILHDSVDEKYDLDSGEVLSHVIPNVRALIAVVAVMRAAKEQKLSGEEIRFLRKSLGRKAKDFAEDVGISPEQLSRYENNKQPISLIYERFLRAAVCLGHFDEAYRIGIDMKNLLAMRIRSACLAEDRCVMHLCLIPEDEFTNPRPRDSLPSEPAWRKTG
jgi:transcriptional regulator with XRE-family HTH domain